MPPKYITVGLCSTVCAEAAGLLSPGNTPAQIECWCIGCKWKGENTGWGSDYCSRWCAISDPRNIRLPPDDEADLPTMSPIMADPNIITCEVCEWKGKPPSYITAGLCSTVCAEAAGLLSPGSTPAQIERCWCIMCNWYGENTGWGTDYCSRGCAISDPRFWDQSDQEQSDEEDIVCFICSRTAPSHAMGSNVCSHYCDGTATLLEQLADYRETGFEI